MKTPLTSELEPYLERLRALPFVKRVDALLPDRSANQEGDARLSLLTAHGRHDLAVEVKAMPLSRSAAQSLVMRALRQPARPWIVFSPYVARPVGEVLESHHIDFVDRAGNCHLAVDPHYLAHVEGRRPERPSRQGRGLGARSYQVLFALLARPELVSAPVRALAEAAGVGKTVAADLVQRLKDEGLVSRDKAGLRLVRPGALMDRWVAGYTDRLRPRLLVGRYRAAAKEASALEDSVAAVLEEGAWAWGGATAGYRLTQHYRSPTTTLHVAAAPATMARQLGLLPSKDGPILVLGVPGPLGLDGPSAHIAHPLLVYTELLVEGDERALEAAAEIRGRFLGRIG